MQLSFASKMSIFASTSWFIAALLLIHSSISAAENIVYPSDAGVIDITKPPYNADPLDNDNDDTAAIQQALNDYAASNTIIYLPNGIYNISDTLVWGGSQKRTILQGQSTSGAILKLTENTAGFDNPAVPKAVINTGEAPAQRFRNSIRNLTVQVAAGNIGAIGIQYISNNQGSIRSVRVESMDRTGVVGLDFNFTGQIGPALIKDVEIVGFDIGIYSDALNSLTFENIRLTEQNVVGFKNEQNLAIIRGLDSRNSVTALHNGDKTGAVVAIVDSRLNGRETNAPAIVNNGTLHARNIDIKGHGKLAVLNNTGMNINANGDIDEFAFSSDSILRVNSDSAIFPLNLPIKETPEILLEADFKKWANPLDYGAWGDGINDDSEFIQAAIDDVTKNTLYIPNRVGGGKNIGNIQNGDWVAYSNIDLTGITKISLRASRARTGSGRFEVRLDSVNGPMIGQVNIGSTNNWDSFTASDALLNAPSGIHDVYLIGKVSSGPVADIDSITFSGLRTFSIEAENFNAANSVSVYDLPPLEFKVSELVLRGNIERVIGTEGRLSGNGIIRVIDDVDTPDSRIIEQIEILRTAGNDITISHESLNTLTVRSVTGPSILSETGSGDFFIEDVVSGSAEFSNNKQSIWLRQFNVENGEQTNIINDGAQLWILGLKTENRQTKVLTKNKGKTEIIGGFFYGTANSPPLSPLLSSVDAEVSYAGLLQTSFSNGYFEDYVQVETNGIQTALQRTDIGNEIALFSDHQSPTVFIEATDGLADEQGDRGTFKITRVGAYHRDIVVKYTISGTASSGIDFEQRNSATSGYKKIKASDDDKSLRLHIKVIDDELSEGDESVIFTLLPSNAFEIPLNKGSASIVIKDDD